MEINSFVTNFAIGFNVLQAYSDALELVRRNINAKHSIMKEEQKELQEVELLQQLFDRFIDKVIQRLQPQLVRNRTEDEELGLIYKQDAMVKYHFSASTAQKWQRKKIVTPHKIGKKVWYLEPEIRRAMGIDPPVLY